MASESIGHIIEITRKAKGISLNQLEAATKLDRASIRRMERDESVVPRGTDRILADLFYSTHKERLAFIENCKRDRLSGAIEKKQRRQRRKEMTAASKRFIVKPTIKPFPELDGYSSLSFDKQHKPIIKISKNLPWNYKGTMVAFRIFDRFASPEKKDLGFICPIALSFNLYDLPGGRGTQSESESSWASMELPPHFDTPEKLEVMEELGVRAMLHYCYANRIGKYALIDLVRREIEKFDVFNLSKYQSSGIDNENVIIDTATIDNMMKVLQKIGKERSAKARNTAIESCIFQLQYFQSRGLEVVSQKKKLLDQIEWINTIIDRVLSKKLTKLLP